MPHADLILRFQPSGLFLQELLEAFLANALLQNFRVRHCAVHCGKRAFHMAIGQCLGAEQRGEPRTVDVELEPLRPGVPSQPVQFLILPVLLGAQLVDLGGLRDFGDQGLLRLQPTSQELLVIIVPMVSNLEDVFDVAIGGVVGPFALLLEKVVGPQ